MHASPPLSVRIRQRLASRWRGARNGYLSWVVDDALELRRLMAFGVDMAISNEPLALMAAAQEDCRQLMQDAANVAAAKAY